MKCRLGETETPRKYLEFQLNRHCKPSSASSPLESAGPWLSHIPRRTAGFLEIPGSIHATAFAPRRPVSRVVPPAPKGLSQKARGSGLSRPFFRLAPCPASCRHEYRQTTEPCGCH